MHAPGKLAEAARADLRQTSGLDDDFHRFAALPAVEHTPHDAGVVEKLLDLQVREPVKVLGEVSQGAPDFIAARRQVFAIDSYAAARWGQQRRQDAHERRLTRAVGA